VLGLVAGGGAADGVGVEAAVEELQGMGYAEAVREIGVR